MRASEKTVDKNAARGSASSRSVIIPLFDGLSRRLLSEAGSNAALSHSATDFPDSSFTPPAAFNRRIRKTARPYLFVQEVRTCLSKKGTRR